MNADRFAHGELSSYLRQQMLKLDLWRFGIFEEMASANTSMPTNCSPNAGGDQR